MNKKQKDFSAVQVGVLLESMDKKIDFLVESQTGNIKRFEAIDKRFDFMQREMDYKFEAVFGELKKFDMVFGELKLIRNDLKQKVNRSELAL